MIKRVEKNSNKIVVGKKECYFSMIYYSLITPVKNMTAYEILLRHIANIHGYLKHNLNLISNLKNTIYFCICLYNCKIY